jgi:hypothetical protein
MQFRLACAIALVLCSSCGKVREFADDAKALMPVAGEVGKALKHRAIQVSFLNGEHLIVRVVNYPLKGVSKEQQSALAEKAATAALAVKSTPPEQDR